MEKLTSKQVRKKWIDFWVSKGHQAIESKSLIPKNDPSLLWINSGVATLKDYFSGKKIPKNPRITSSQKSIRTNDIDNVGITSRHHTLFEMLGNFSIGEYFKNEVLEWAFELLFDVFKFDKSKIYITYFNEDIETYNKWIELGIKPSHLIKGNKEMNFWDVGQGPCGPDTEIFYDRGTKYDSKNIGIKLLEEDIENDRYVEIWNIVFSQYNNNGDGSYIELKQKNIDTGAGLERIVSIFQDAPTNFDTDLFKPIIHEVEKISNSKYIVENYFINDPAQKKVNKHFKIIADHIRAIVLAINDGALPSNTSRGYIIRRLLRRAYRSGMQLGISTKSFLYTLVPIVIDVLEIKNIDLDSIINVISKEELLFEKTIKQGEELFEKSTQNKNELDFSIAFKLFETYGFPIELTQELAAAKGIKLDISKFDDYKKKHAKLSRSKNTNFGMESQIQVIQEVESEKSCFVGYDKLEEDSKILFSKMENNKFYTLVTKTPFYATSGGQEKDYGTINGIEVIDVFKDKHKNIWHITKHGIIGESAKLIVDKEKRLNKNRNHTATHLLAKALRTVFGDSVIQKGSYNDEFKLRFDFPLNKKPNLEQIKEVELLVNNYIKEAHPRNYIITTYKNALSMGAITLEDELYEENVRVVDLGVSKEFCGGTHVENTSAIEKFKIIKIESKGSGIFRIEAITSNLIIDKYILELKNKLLDDLNKIISKNKQIDSKYKINYKNDINSIQSAIKNAKLDNKKLNKNIKNNNKINISDIKISNIDGIETYQNFDVLPIEVKPLAIAIREKFPDALIIIGAKTKNGTLIAIASKKYNSHNELKSRYNNIKGGGSSDFAMGNIPT